MNTLWILLTVIVICFSLNQNEHLRIHGSFDIRGDPFPILQGGVGPFNISANSPKYRRTMTIGANPYVSVENLKSKQAVDPYSNKYGTTYYD